MIKPFIVKDKDRKIDVKVDLSGLESIIEEARGLVRFERDGFYQEVYRVLKEDEAGDDLVSILNRLKETFNGNGTITDLESFREGISQIIDTIDYLSNSIWQPGTLLNRS